MLFIRGLGRRIVEAEGIEFGKEAKVPRMLRES